MLASKSSNELGRGEGPKRLVNFELRAASGDTGEAVPPNRCLGVGTGQERDAQLGGGLVAADKDAGVDDDGVEGAVLEEGVGLELVRRGLDALLIVDVKLNDMQPVLVGREGGEVVEKVGGCGVAHASDDADGRARFEEGAGVAETEAAGGTCARKGDQSRETKAAIERCRWRSVEDAQERVGTHR